MAECQVTCYSGCRNDKGNGPKVWHWLCETCAEECLESHRKQTGHTDLHLQVTKEGSIHDLRRQIRRASKLMPARL